MTRYHLANSVTRLYVRLYVRECAAANGSLLIHIALFPLIVQDPWTRVRTELKRGRGRGKGPLATPRSHARAPCKFFETERARERKRDGEIKNQQTG
mgnify:CR=1 FL=1